MSFLREDLAHGIARIRAVDTHAHLLEPEAYGFSGDCAEAFVSGLYLWDDLRSAGYAPEEGFRRAFAAAYPLTRNTTYARVFAAVLADVYDIPFQPDDPAALDELGARASLAYADPAGWFSVLMERYGIESVCVDRGQTTEFERDLWSRNLGHPLRRRAATEATRFAGFLPVLRMDLLAFAFHPAAQDAIREKYGLEVREPDAFDAFLDGPFPAFLAEWGVVAVKSALEYLHAADYLPTDRETFRALWNGVPDEEGKRRFAGYALDRVADACARAGVPMQLHTGFHCCKTGRNAYALQPSLPAFFDRHPETGFELFHAAYPDIMTACAVVKTKANVRLNINWLPAISEATAVRYLDELLDAVPCGKIIWGSDAGLMEEACIHARLMRDILADVLARRMERGADDTESALSLARLVLRENALRFRPEQSV